MPEVTLTINGQTVVVPAGTLVIEAAKKIGIDIPVFCYHEKLEPVGACRQCLVEIEGFPKPQVSCSTPVAEGMVVRTDTPAVKQMWKANLEFLLINHPLDCPVCDRGGECPLQNNTFAFGPDDSRFEHEKRHFEKPVQLSERVVIDRERCIQCFRCVRFQREIADHPQIQMFNRGYGDYIDRAATEPFDSNFSGNTIELCPVGALLSSVFRFKARPWEIKSTESVCPDCGVGCNIKIDSRNNRQVVRYLSRENPEVDDGWLCDRGRFDSEFINSPNRLTEPLVRKNGELVEVSWEEALSAALEGMRAAGDSVGGLGSSRCTNEANYLFQKFLRQAIGTNNTDYSVEPRASGGVDVLAAAISSGLFNGAIADIEDAQVIIVIGSDVSRDLPVIDLWIKKAVRQRDAKLIVAHHRETELNKYAASFLKYEEGKEAEFIGKMAAGRMEGVKKACILLSQSLVESTQNGDAVINTVRDIAESARGGGAEVGVMQLCAGANPRGATDVGVIPGYGPGYRKLDAANCWSGAEMINESRAMWIMGQDPAGHGPEVDQTKRALSALGFLAAKDTTQLVNLVDRGVTLTGGIPPLLAVLSRDDQYTVGRASAGTKRTANAALQTVFVSQKHVPPSGARRKLSLGFRVLYRHALLDQHMFHRHRKTPE